VLERTVRECLHKHGAEIVGLLASRVKQAPEGVCAE
jgi:hypothetical protein